MQGLSPNAVYGLASLACAAAGAICDVRTRRIPHWVTGPGILLGLLLHLFLGGWGAMGSAALAGLMAGSVFLLFNLVGGMGADDVKLIAAVCCLAGFGAVAQILVGTALTAGLAAVLLALFHRRTRETLSNVGRRLLHHGTSSWRLHPDLNVNHSSRLGLPYGLAIAAGAASSVYNVFLR